MGFKIKLIKKNLKYIYLYLKLKKNGIIILDLFILTITYILKLAIINGTNLVCNMGVVFVIERNEFVYFSLAKGTFFGENLGCIQFLVVTENHNKWHT